MSRTWGGGRADEAADEAMAAAVDAARQDLAALHRHPANRRGWPRTAAAGAVRGARASAALDGGNPAIDAAAGSINDPVLAGALRVAAALGGLVEVWRRSPLQALARLHLLAAADLVDDPGQLGRPQRGADRLATLSSAETMAELPAPVQVAAVHGLVLTSRPFDAGNGVVARAAGRLVAMSTGLDPHGLGVPEVAMLRSPRYRGSVGTGPSGELDVWTQTPEWIIAQCGWLCDGAREGVSIAETSG